MSNKLDGSYGENALAPKQMVSFEELIMSQIVQQEALTRLLVKKGIFTKEEFLDMVRVVDKDIKKSKQRWYQDD